MTAMFLFYFILFYRISENKKIPLCVLIETFTSSCCVVTSQVCSDVPLKPLGLSCNYVRFFVVNASCLFAILQVFCGRILGDVVSLSVNSEYCCCIIVDIHLDAGVSTPESLESESTLERVWCFQSTVTCLQLNSRGHEFSREGVV